MTAIEQALQKIKQRITMQEGDHPHPSDYMSVGDLLQAQATLFLAQQVERVADRMDDIASCIDEEGFFHIFKKGDF